MNAIRDERRSAFTAAGSDDEFVEELRSHLPERSWWLSHLVELEQRGFELTEGDPELHAAIAEELDRVSNAALEPVLVKIAASLTPLHEHFRKLATSLPGINISSLVPSSDVAQLMLPTQEWLGTTFRAAVAPPDIADLSHPRRTALTDPAIIDETAAAETIRLNAEAVRQRQQLVSATPAVAVLLEIRELIAAGNRRDWYTWLPLSRTAIAAIAVRSRAHLQISAGGSVHVLLGEAPAVVGSDDPRRRDDADLVDAVESQLLGLRGPQTLDRGDQGRS